MSKVAIVNFAQRRWRDARARDLERLALVSYQPSDEELRQAAAWKELKQLTDQWHAEQAVRRKRERGAR
jgi:hypothetical protein